MRVLGVDLGEVRTGLAVSTEIGNMASGITTVTEPDFNRLATAVAGYIRDYHAGLVVIGYPVNMNGTKGAACERAENFVSIFKEISDVPVVLYDERCTTAMAHKIMNETDTRGKKRKARVDTLSAEIILQNYLDAHPNLVNS